MTTPDTDIDHDDDREDEATWLQEDWEYDREEADAAALDAAWEAAIERRRCGDA